MPLYAGDEAESEEESTYVHPGATGVWLQCDARYAKKTDIFWCYVSSCNLC